MRYFLLVILYRTLTTLLNLGGSIRKALYARLYTQWSIRKCLYARLPKVSPILLNTYTKLNKKKSLVTLWIVQSVTKLNLSFFSFNQIIQKGNYFCQKTVLSLFDIFLFIGVFGLWWLILSCCLTGVYMARQPKTLIEWGLKGCCLVVLYLLIKLVIEKFTYIHFEGAYYL